MHERYVDDANVVERAMEIGARYDGEQITVTAASIQEDQHIPADERTMTLLKSIAAYIHPSIR